MFHSVLKIRIQAISFHLNKFKVELWTNRTLDEQTSGLRVIQLRTQNYGDKWLNITLPINWTSNCLLHTPQSKILCHCTANGTYVLNRIWKLIKNIRIITVAELNDSTDDKVKNQKLWKLKYSKTAETLSIKVNSLKLVLWVC